MTNQTNESNRGGRREGAGRPTTDTKSVTIRLTPLEHDILRSLGGSKYLRGTLGRLAELTEDLARDLIEECEGDFQSAVDCCWGDSIEYVCEMLPDDLSELERQAVIDNASWLLEHERDQIGGNRYTVEVTRDNRLTDVSSVSPEDVEFIVDCYKRFEFVAKNDDEAQTIVEKAQDEADAQALRILEIEDPYEQLAREFYAASPKLKLYRVAQFGDEYLDTFSVE